MTTKKIYGPWIKWHGGECPVPLSTRVRVKRRYGSEVEDFADNLYWFHDIDNNNIVSYCTITEQPDLEAAEKLLRANGYTVTPPTKPITFKDVTPTTEVPRSGRRYWAVSGTAEEGVCELGWFSHEAAHILLKRRLVYLEKEDALIAARHIFGLKGGEL